MILSQPKSEGIGDPWGTIAAEVRDRRALVHLLAEWNRLRHDGLGAVFRTVTSQECPLQMGSVEFEGSFHTVVALEEALKRVDASAGVVFEFSEHDEPPARYWGYTMLSVEIPDERRRAEVTDRLAEIYRRGLQTNFPSDLPVDQAGFRDLAETGVGCFLSHSKVDAVFERALTVHSVEFELSSSPRDQPGD